MDPRKIVISKEELYQKYIVENMSRADCATFFNTTDRTIKRRLEEFGIKKDPKKRYENIEKTTLERFGVKHAAQNEICKEKAKKTMLKKYGYASSFESPEISEKIKETMFQKYGRRSYPQTDEYKRKAIATNQEKYGVDWFVFTKDYKNKTSKTCLKKYNSHSYMQSDDFHTKSIETCKEKYGVPYSCMREECRKYSKNNSKPNLDFANLLDKNKIEYEREFVLENYSYDFKVGNYLFEINPSIFHNSTFSPVGNPKDRNYHKNKSNTARNHGFRCIHIWDWDNMDKIVSLFLLQKERIFARDCEIKEVAKEDAVSFVNEYHLQGYAKDEIRIGLFYKNNLISIMTFGKPRYNSNYQYELVRYCTSKNIVGGAEKLFKYFVKTYNPQSMVSYCDLSKFDGDVYKELGFTSNGKPNPSKHWVSLKNNMHITDNLLRQKGFDKLFKTNHGKGTSNEELMLRHGFIEVYDCGQMTLVWEK